MQRIFVSACLLGQPVRYDGQSVPCDSEILVRWQREGRLVALCPEMAGGLPVPRVPAEIGGGAGGAAVLAGVASVLDQRGHDVTDFFVRGAEAALRVVQEQGIRLAILKENSPSCGSHFTYDGQFSGKRIASQGVTAARLVQLGVRVFSENELAEAALYLKAIDARRLAPSLIEER